MNRSNKKLMLMYGMVGLTGIALLCVFLAVISLVTFLCNPTSRTIKTIYYRNGKTCSFEVRGEVNWIFFWSFRSKYANDMFLPCVNLEDGRRRLDEFYIKAGNGDTIFHYRKGEVLICADPKDYPRDFDDITIEKWDDRARVQLEHNQGFYYEQRNKRRSRAKIKISSDGENWYSFPTRTKDLPKIFGPMEKGYPKDVKWSWI